MARVIVRMWNAEGYHKDVAILDEQQVRMHMAGMESNSKHLVAPFGPKVIVDPKQFPEAIEFEVIVEPDRHPG